MARMQGSSSSSTGGRVAPIHDVCVLCGSLVGSRKRVADSSRGGRHVTGLTPPSRVPSRWIAGNPPLRRDDEGA